MRGASRSTAPHSRTRLPFLERAQADPCPRRELALNQAGTTTVVDLERLENHGGYAEGNSSGEMICAWSARSAA
jgi:hypothetical protein